VAASYHLNIMGEEPAARLARILLGPPGHLPRRPDGPRLAVVVAITIEDEQGISDDSEVTVARTRAELARPGDRDDARENLSFTVDRARLPKAYPPIQTTDFEE
jgi:hypothetical protein